MKKILKIVIISIICATLAIPIIIGAFTAAMAVVGTVVAWMANPTIMLIMLLIGVFILLPIVALCVMVK